MLLRNSDASSFFLVGIARGQAWTILFLESLNVERTKKNWQRCRRMTNAELRSETCFFHQELKMELKVKNLASSDSRGCDLQKEVMVKVTNQRTHEVRLCLGTGASLHKASRGAFLGTRLVSLATDCGDPAKGRAVFQV